MILFAAAFAGGCLALIIYRQQAERLNLRAIPNHRSSHAAPILTGAGLALWAVVGPTWLLAAATGVAGAPASIAALVAGGTLLAVVGWLDDRQTLSPLLRLVLQIAVAAVSLSLLAESQRLLSSSIPLAVERALMLVGWVWFMNLCNFMDGADGLMSSEAITISVGLLVLSKLLPLPTAVADLTVLLLGALLAFLIWNWPPATLFLGDAGSITIGFVLGWALLQTALAGAPWAAAILPLFFLVDATATLLRRIVAGRRFWEPHREHFYQAPLRHGVSHSGVLWHVVPANVLLVPIAAASVWYPVAAFVLACLIVLVLLRRLSRLGAQTDATAMQREPIA